jgi:glutamine synthetase
MSTPHPAGSPDPLGDPRPGGRPGEPERATAVAEQLAATGVHGVVLSWIDTAGINRIKTIPVARLASACRWGVGMSPVFDAFLADDSIASTETLGTPDGDLRMFPDLDQLVALHGQPGWAWAPVDRLTQDGDVYPGCSRSLLRRLVVRAQDAGLAFQASFEIEFALGLDDVPAQDFAAACRGSAYGMTRLVEQSDFCADALAALAAEGVAVDQIHPEYAAGQYEVSVGVLDPVAAADRSVLVRQTLRALAQRHGLRISFSPSVVAGGVGNGGHIHLSAWRDGTNLHTGGAGPLGMTSEAQSFVAGIVDELPGLTALLTPSPASFLRLQPSHWAGVYACWGHETRESAVRLVTGTVGNRERAANLEVKCADLAANPYLALAGVLAAGLAGLERQAPLGEPVTGDPARFDEQEQRRRGVRRLPLTLSEALAEFEASSVLTAALGELLTAAVVTVRSGEQTRASGLTPEAVAQAYRWVY